MQRGKKEKERNLSELFLFNVQSVQFRLYLGKAAAMFRLDLFRRCIHFLTLLPRRESTLWQNNAVLVSARLASNTPQPFHLD